MEWKKYIFDFDDIVDGNEELLLAGDLRERLVIEKQELGRVERALEQVGTRLDTGRMVSAMDLPPEAGHLQ